MISFHLSESTSWYNQSFQQMCLLIWTSSSGERCGPWASCLLWRWLTIFSTWVYHYKRMCPIHSLSQYDADLGPQGQIYKVFVISLCLTSNFCLLWHLLPYLAHRCINIRGHVSNIHDPPPRFDLKVEFIGFLT